MKVVLYGATGRAGSRILQELLSRGHSVVAAARDTKSLEPAVGLTFITDDLSDVSRISEIIGGADAVISAYAPPPDNTDELVAVTERLIEAVKRSGVPRLLVVGGAGGLDVAPGISLVDSGHLPPEWLSIASSHIRTLNVLRASPIDWTYLAPSAYFEPGTRTGKFRLGTDTLLSNDKGESRISMEDYAIAMVDEIENPRHRRQRFTVGH